MHVALVNIFDALPGELMHEGRYIALARALVARGHRVTWYTSDFQHHTKVRRDVAAVQSAAARQGYEIAFVPGCPYRTNVSVARLRNHRQVARGLELLWAKDARPDVLCVSLPPPGVAWEASRWAARVEVPLVLDVQDLWPQTFARFLPRPLKWMQPILFGGMNRHAHAAYRQADAVVAVAEEYWPELEPHLLPQTLRHTLSLGVDLAKFDTSASDLTTTGLVKAPGERWIFLSGSLGSYLDLDALVGMMSELRRRGRQDTRLLVVGSGPMEGPLRERLQSAGITDAILTGNRSYGDYVTAMVHSDVAVLPVRADSFVFFPNRIFQYWAAGLPVVNTVAGKVAAILAQTRTGLTCQPPTPASMADAAEALLAAGPPSADFRQRRGAWLAAYDRAAISRRLADVLEQAAARGGTPCEEANP